MHVTMHVLGCLLIKVSTTDYVTRGHGGRLARAIVRDSSERALAGVSKVSVVRVITGLWPDHTRKGIMGSSADPLGYTSSTALPGADLGIPPNQSQLKGRG